MNKKQKMIRVLLCFCAFSIYISGLFVVLVFAAPAQATQDALAAATFGAVERKRVALEQLHFVGHGTKDKVMLKKLIRTLQSLKRGYMKILPLKSPRWSQAAMFRIGQLYLILAEKIRNAPQPTIFSARAAKKHKQIIELFAARFEGPALNTFSKAIQHAAKHAISNRWVVLTKKHHAQLLAARRKRKTAPSSQRGMK